MNEWSYERKNEYKIIWLGKRRQGVGTEVAPWRSVESGI